MIRWMRVVLPPSRWVIILVAVFVIPYLCVHVGYRVSFHSYTPSLRSEAAQQYAEMQRKVLAQELAEMRKRFLTGFVVLSCLVHGVYRVFAFHPLLRVDYRKWLESTPWTSSKQLPLGPVHLVWQDAVVVVALSLLGICALKLPCFAALLMVLLPYLLSMTLALRRTGEHGITYAMAFGFGLLILLSGHLTWVTAVTVALYALALVGLRRSLRRFPWDLQADSAEADVRGASARAAYAGTLPSMLTFSLGLNELFSDPPTRPVITRWLGWPFDKLNPGAPLCSLTRANGLILSLLAGWYLYSLNGLPDLNAWDTVTLGTFRLVVVLAALARVLMYCSGYSPPISLLGRIFTGRWIIPGYDRVFVAPLCAIVAGIIAPMLLTRWGLPLGAAIPISASFVLMILLTAGPRLPHWRLTGSHRLVPSSLNRAEFVKI
jgi:hypothetical protein